MRKLLYFIIAFCTICIISCKNSSNNENSKVRFVTIENHGNFKVVYDTASLVEYSVSKYGQFNMLLDSFGNPKTHH